MVPRKNPFSVRNPVYLFLAIGLEQNIRILSGSFKVVMVRLVCLFDLVAVPHGPEEGSFGKDLDFCGVFTC